MNQAFIDGQNLNLGTKNSKEPWKIDLIKFRIYLNKKYHVHSAYYFIGYYNQTNSELYDRINNAGYNLVFRAHNHQMGSIKKGNVDTDIVFEVMKKLVSNELSGKVVLVSGDGDYFKMVNFLIQNNKFEKLLAPDENKMSSLYKQLNPRYYAFLSRRDVKNKIKIKNAGPA